MASDFVDERHGALLGRWVFVSTVRRTRNRMPVRRPQLCLMSASVRVYLVPGFLQKAELSCRL